jgi:peptidoglycan/xylan/chitin deacetylase (PgdA/CDA1 family)
MGMWPNGARAAAAFTFDFDAEALWIGEDPANADKPGVLSQGSYGARVAVPRILEILDAHGVRVTFFVPGVVAERHPDRVKEIVGGGHELAHHGFTHTSPTRLSLEEEELELTRGLDALAAFGAEVIGYRSPSWDFSTHTLRLLHQHGFRYSSNLMDDHRPYRHDGTGIVELPVQWILDDAAHFWFDAATWTKKISTVSEVATIWAEEFEGITEAGGCTIFTMHPQFIGRPSRLALLDELIGRALQRDVWVATCAEIAARVP